MLENVVNNGHTCLGGDLGGTAWLARQGNIQAAQPLAGPQDIHQIQATVFRILLVDALKLRGGLRRENQRCRRSIIPDRDTCFLGAVPLPEGDKPIAVSWHRYQPVVKFSELFTEKQFGLMLSWHGAC